MKAVLSVREVFHSPVAAHRHQALEQLAQAWLRAIARRDEA